MEINNLEKLLEKYFSIVNTTSKTDPQVGSDKTFYIYTTGLANWNDNNDVIIDIWKDCRYDNIIKQIPDYFNNIIIDHYDPIEVIGESKREIKEQIDSINTILKKQDDDTKKTKQTFYKQYFDHKNIDTSKPYIVLDFASIYYYNYNKSNNDFYLTVKYNQEEKIYINCIHIPLPTEFEDIEFPKNNWCDNYYENIKYFIYDPINNKITTFIQLFFEILDNNYQEMYQNIYITNFINRELYNTQVIGYVRSKTEGVNEDVNEWLKNNIKKDLFMEFFEKLFNPLIDINSIKSIVNYRIYKLLEERFNLQN